MVGPFVVMIYKMIRGDLLRFFIIYIVFLVGFSQGETFEILFADWVLKLLPVDFTLFRFGVARLNTLNRDISIIEIGKTHKYCFASLYISFLLVKKNCNNHNI